MHINLEGGSLEEHLDERPLRVCALGIGVHERTPGAPPDLLNGLLTGYHRGHVHSSNRLMWRSLSRSHKCDRASPAHTLLLYLYC